MEYSNKKERGVIIVGCSGAGRTTMLAEEISKKVNEIGVANIVIGTDEAKIIQQAEPTYVIHNYHTPFAKNEIALSGRENRRNRRKNKK